MRLSMPWKATTTFYTYSRKMITADNTLLGGLNKVTLLVAVAKEDNKNWFC